MTLKTVQQASNSTINKASKSDMQKRSAVKKNLFDSVPDRDELTGQLEQYEQESNRTLSEFKIESVIGVIVNSSYQPRKLKRVPRCLESDDDSDADSEETELNREASSDEPSSSSTASSKSSAKESDVKPIQKKIPLPKGQSTLNGKHSAPTTFNLFIFMSNETFSF